MSAAAICGLPDEPERASLQKAVEKYFVENVAYAGLGREAARNGVTLLFVKAANVIIQLASTVIMARLLTPYDVGLVALVLTLTGFASLAVDLGSADAAMQRSRVSPEEISSLFWLNIAIGLILTALLAGSSGWLAGFFREPALAGIAFVSSFTFILAALQVQHSSLMRRAMELRRIVMIELGANAASSLVSVAMALSGWGYWAMVVKPLLHWGLVAVGSWWACPWRPGRPRATPEVKGLVRSGLGVAGFMATDLAARSADRLALGWLYGAGSLGYFQNALILYNNVLQVLTEHLHNLAAASLSKLRSDPAELKRSWAAALSAAAFFMAPVFAALAVVGEDFVVILLGEKWAPAGPLLCIFAVRGIVHGIERTHGWLHIVAGRSDRWLRWGLFSAVCQVLAVAAGLPFGPIGVAASYTVVMFALVVPAVAYSGGPVGISAGDVVRTVGPQILAALVAIAVTLAAQQQFMAGYSHWARLLLSGGISVVVYLSLAVGVLGLTGPLKLIWLVLRDLAGIKARRA